MSPSSAPSVQVTAAPSEATHRFYNRDWWPVFDTFDSSFLVAENNLWPQVPGDASDYEYSVLIPVGSVVTYAKVQSSTKFDKVVVEGTLLITNELYHDVSLTVSTLLVEPSGNLTITSNGPNSIEIIFHGTIDRINDPTETMNGLVSLGGNVLIEG